MRARWRITELVETLLSPAACEVLETWLGDYHFLDNQGDPALLSLAETEKSEFGQLVQRTNQRIEVSNVFLELTRLGLVEQLDTGYVMLRRSAYGPGNAGPSDRPRPTPADEDMPYRRYTDTHHTDIHPGHAGRETNKDKKP
jgi:hypothetical protein